MKRQQMKAGFCRGYTLQRTKLAVTIRDDELVVPQFIRTGLSMSLVRQNSQITQCVNNRMKTKEYVNPEVPVVFL